MRLGEEISGLNLRDLMKVQDEDEIMEIRPEVEETETARHRQTMGSILSINEAAGGRKLWEVIQAEEQSKAWERPRDGILKNVLRLVVGKKEPDPDQIREEEEEDNESVAENEEEETETFRLLDSWNATGTAAAAERSPAVLDSARRLHTEEERLQRLGRLEDSGVRVYLVGGSSPASEQSMDGANRQKWKALMQKLRFRKFACCGSSWSAAAAAERSNLSSTPVILPEEGDETSWSGSGRSDPPGPGIDPPPLQNNEDNETTANAAATTSENNNPETCEAEAEAEVVEVRPSGVMERRQQLITLFGRNFEPADAGGAPATEGSEIRVSMNLAAALAAERQLRAAQERESIAASNPRGAMRPPSGSSTPLRVSLMSLLEEADNRGGAARGGTVASATTTSLLAEEWDTGGCGVADDPLCCVCMVRRKGAAFIPCGHTFCRLCTRELWVSRGSCPLCNRHIIEILDIF